MDVRVALWRKWAPKNWCFWTVVLEKTLESPLDCKEIQPVHSKGDQSWRFIGRNDAKVETPVPWPPQAKSWLIGKASDAVRDWDQEEKGMTEDEMAGWHHRLNGCESERTPGVGDGQEGLACCSSWGHKELDTTEWLNWTESDYLKIEYLVKIKNNNLNPLLQSLDLPIAPLKWMPNNCHWNIVLFMLCFLKFQVFLFFYWRNMKYYHTLGIK